jgi:hypothetical protein
MVQKPNKHYLPRKSPDAAVLEVLQNTHDNIVPDEKIDAKHYMDVAFPSDAPLAFLADDEFLIPNSGNAKNTMRLKQIMQKL